MSRKFIVIGAPRAQAMSDQLAPLMIPEIEAVWRDYRSGLIREIYERIDRQGVVIICEADDPAAVHAMVDGLPLYAAGLLDVSVLEVGPFALWETLFNRSDRLQGT